MKKMLIAAACASVLALSLWGCGSGGAAASGDGNGITVSASSETKVVPDKARISVSVVTEGKTAEECQSQNSASTNAVIDALKALGVEDKSIQTTYSDLSPRYGSRVSDSGDKKSKDSEEVASVADGKDEVAYDEWVITGYEMTTSLSVSDLEIDNVGTAMQACVSAGANDASGVEYYASNYDEMYNEALAKALETAHGKAEGIANASGAKLGKVVNVVEGYQDTSARYETLDASMMESADNAVGAAAKVMAGQIGITANITVTYAIA